ncbi:MAG: hypothetical protein EOP71_05325, partial [Variovorax sp.]
ARRRHEVGEKLVSPTNHAAFLRYADTFRNVSTVSQVLSYDLTVGPGYAFGDEAYWNYLLDLADWKKSDPYYSTGESGMDNTGGTLTEASGIEHAPPGIDRRTVTPSTPTAPRRQGGDAWRSAIATNCPPPRTSHRPRWPWPRSACASARHRPMRSGRRWRPRRDAVSRRASRRQRRSPRPTTRRNCCASRRCAACSGTGPPMAGAWRNSSRATRFPGSSSFRRSSTRVSNRPT